MVVLGQYEVVPIVEGGTGAIVGRTGWYLVVLGQYGAVLVCNW